jgi:hypothetical protein
VASWYGGDHSRDGSFAELPWLFNNGSSWNCFYTGESNCLIETELREDVGRPTSLVTSAQCSECESKGIQTSPGKRRE